MNLFHILRNLNKAVLAYKAQNAAHSRTTGVFAETMQNFRTVEAMSLKEKRDLRLDTSIAEYIGIKRHIANIRIGLMFPLYLISYFTPIVVLILGKFMLDKDWVSIGELTTLVLYSWQIREPLFEMSTWVDEVQTAIASFSRIIGVGMAREYKIDKDRIPVNNKIKIKGLSFCYDGKKEVLSDINLEINPGERIAIVGPSGAGKTTLGKMIAGIHKPQKGEILLGDVPITELPENLRASILMLSQEQHIFMGSIKDNLTMGVQNINVIEIWKALKAIGANEWVKSLDCGLDTLVGSGEINLSESEGQEIALARIILLSPRILILDEATSMLDPQTARHLEKALAKVLEGKTVISIAHRLFTAHDADRIIVVADGRIEEIGSHDELILKGGKYAELWQSWQSI